ncbi:hypothetical protein [Promicromonospora sp. NPDC023987]|uniref:hypothetical protein n=1 Tax=Promicromonospora sp. NPDC023987 TaxID=3155360 RepID=UPI0033F740E0
MAAVVFLVLAVVGVQLACTMHLNQHAGGAAHAHGGHGHAGEHSSAGGALAVHDVATGHVDVVEPEAGGASGCSEHDTVTAQSEPLLLPSPVLATTPESPAIRLTPAAVYQDHRMASALSGAAAPSLHALGINRT